MKTLITSVILISSLFASSTAFAVGPVPATSTTLNQTLSDELSDNDLATTESKMNIKDLAKNSDGIRYNSTEAGFQLSSINNGSLFMQVGILHEWQNGVAIGLRGSMPMNYTGETQIYMGQALLRFHLVNEINLMYLEPSFTQGYFSGDNGTSTFAMGGLTYGYSRHVRPNFTIGGRVGVDYATNRISNEKFRYVETIYNNIGITGSYAF